MTPRSIEVRCVHVGDVLVRKVCPAVGARPVGDATDALGDLDYDIHAVLRDADDVQRHHASLLGFGLSSLSKPRPGIGEWPVVLCSELRTPYGISVRVDRDQVFHGRGFGTCTDEPLGVVRQAVLQLSRR